MNLRGARRCEGGVNKAMGEVEPLTVVVNKLVNAKARKRLRCMGFCLDVPQMSVVFSLISH